ncbi:flippase [Nocardioides marinquilinus]|uniref:Flippase n=1 Tax=Nocardioides marinquilinus TaxID=1210400 RepID=A0ABP9P7D3_9ACTN
MLTPQGDPPEPAEATDPPEPPERAERGLVGNAGALLGSRLVKAVLGWGGTVLIARTLSLEDFGVFSLVFTVLGLMSIVTEFGIGRLAVRGMTSGSDGAPPDPRFPGSYLMLRIVLGVLGYLVAVGAVAVAGYSAVVVQATAVAGVVILLATPSSAMDVVFQSRMRLGTVAAAETTAITGQVALTAAIAAAGGSLLWFTLPAVLYQVIVLCWKAQVARRLVSLRPRVDLPGWRAMLREAIPLSVGSGLATAYGKVDALLLSKIVGFEAVGIYGVSYKFVDLMEFAATAVTVPLLALLVRHLPDDRPAAQEEFRRAGLLLALFAGAAVVGLVGFAEPLTQTLYGADYAAGADTTRVLAVAQVFNFVIVLVVCVLIALERNQSYPVMMLFGLAVNLGLNAWLIPAYEYLGAGIATLVSNALVAGLAWWLLQRIVPMRVDGVPGCLVAVAVGLGVAFLGDAWLPWPVAAALAGLSYAAVVVALGLPARAGLPWPPPRPRRRRRAGSPS